MSGNVHNTLYCVSYGHAPPQTLAGFQDHVEEIPCVVGGRRVFTGNVKKREVVRTTASYTW